MRVCGAERLRAGAFARSVGLSAPDEATLTLPEPAPAVQQPLAPQKQYAANMGSVIRALTRSRANGQLLHDSEWRAYEEAIASGRYAGPAQTPGQPLYYIQANHLAWRRPARAKKIMSFKVSCMSACFEVMEPERLRPRC